MPGTARTLTYDELAEALHETRRDLADSRAERLQFAERLLRWLRDGSDQTEVGLALPTLSDDSGAPSVWWQADDAAVAALVRLFDEAEADEAVAAAERRAER